MPRLPFAWAAALVALGVVATAARMPLVRRIGLRNARRRPREAALVMLGCVLGTALIVGSAAVGSSYTASIRSEALSQLGSLDAVVSYESRDDWVAASARLNSAPLADVDWAVPAASVEAPLTSNTSVETSPSAKLIEVDYRRAGALVAASDGLAGTGPAAGMAWASPLLAEQLHLKVGSVVTVHTRLPTELTIEKIATSSPLASFVERTSDAGQNLLVPPGTVRVIQAQDPLQITPRWLTLVGAPGRHGDAPPRGADVASLRQRLTAFLGPFNASVSMIRSDNLQRAINVGESSSAFLTTIGVFGILSGALLLVNVLLMLAEERLAELGTMRAVGLGRRALIAAFTLEGAIYAAVGSLLGGLAGVGLGRFMVWIAQKPSAQATVDSRAEFHLHFGVYRSDIVTGVAAGFLLATFVVVATSYRISRLDVIRSIRDLPAPRHKARRAAVPFLLMLVVAGVAVTTYGYLGSSSPGLIFGPTLATVGVGILTGRRFGWTAGVTAACVPNVIWAVIFQMINKSSDVASVETVFGGVLVVMSGVLLVNAHQATAAQLLRRVGRGRATVTSRLGLANPLAHRVRTLLTVAPFALVVFTLSYTEGLSSLITHELGKLAPRIVGDYQVYATSSSVNPYDFASLRTTGTTGIDSVATTSTLISSFSGLNGSLPRLWSLTAFDAHLVDRDPPPLVKRGHFASDRAAYRAVASDPDMAIVPSNFLYSAAQGRLHGDPLRPPTIGDAFTMVDPVTGVGRDLTIAAIGQVDVLGAGAYYGRTGAQAFFGGRLVTNGAFISTSGAPSALVRRLNRAGIDNGLKAVVAQDAANEAFAFVSNVVNLYRSDLGIGIVVGVAGIAVVLIRSARDRRRQIGTLRAMGFDAGQMGWSFLLEGGFVAMQGIAVGVGLGTVTTMALARSTQIRNILGYYPPVPSPPIALASLTIVLLAASLIASAGPARAASRIPPAVALRLVD